MNNNQHSFEGKNIVTGYDKKIIIDGVDITIPSNKISVIIGSNGCGKSTIFNLISGSLENGDKPSPSSHRFQHKLWFLDIFHKLLLILVTIPLSDDILLFQQVFHALQTDQYGRRILSNRGTTYWNRE